MPTRTWGVEHLKSCDKCVYFLGFFLRTSTNQKWEKLGAIKGSHPYGWKLKLSLSSSIIHLLDSWSEIKMCWREIYNEWLNIIDTIDSWDFASLSSSSDQIVKCHLRCGHFVRCRRCSFTYLHDQTFEVDRQFSIATYEQRVTKNQFLSKIQRKFKPWTNIERPYRVWGLNMRVFVTPLWNIFHLLLIVFKSC